MTPAERLSKHKRHSRVLLAVKKKAPKQTVFDCRLKELRAGLGLSIKDVAKEAGFSVAGLFVIEQGNNIELRSALKLSEFFGRPVTDIWRVRK